MPESTEHKAIKKTISDFLSSNYKTSVTEYYDSGFKMDIVSAPRPSVKLMTEVIWTPRWTHFVEDWNRVLASDAQIKIVIVNPKILKKRKLIRYAEKLKNSDTHKGYFVIGMLGWYFDKKDTMLENLRNEIDKALRELKASKAVSKLPKLPEQEYKDEILHELPLCGLDQSEITKCVDILNKSYKRETIIRVVGRTLPYTEMMPPNFRNIGFARRLPREWFLPNQQVPIANDPIFFQWGRNIALSEQNYFEQQMLNSRDAVRLKEGFSITSVLKAIKEMKNHGFVPDLIYPTIKCWVDMHHWHRNAKVKYSNLYPRPRLDASLVINGNNLRVIPPLGDIVKKPIILSSQAVLWHVKKYPIYGALYIAMGNDRLFPEQHVEVIARTTISCEVDPSGIVILET